MTETTATTGTATVPAPEAAVRPVRRLRLPGTGGAPGGSPLFRNAYALMLNTGISAVLGLGFWLAAARYYPESAVGRGSAAIAAMKLLAGVTAVTLTGTLARFIPVSGARTGRLILRTYAAGSLVVAGAAGVFLLTLDAWGPSYAFLHGTAAGIGFTLAVVGWNVLTLQDGVLTGLRSAPWVPVGNTVFSAVKLGLLVAFAVAVPATGVFVSWAAAIATSVLPLGWLVFRRLVPRHVRATAGQARPPTLREIGRFLAGDCTGSLFSLAVVYLVPVIIAAQVSSEDNAYFYITTTIGGTTNLLAVNMGASLTVEGSHEPARLAADTRAALRRMARIMLPVATVLFVGAPWILGVFGAGYADAAAPLLRWFAVGAVLRVVMETYFAVLRAQNRTSGLAWLQGLLCVLVLGLTLLLLPRMGLTGAGVAEVSSLAVIVAVAAPKLWRTLRAEPPAPPPADATAPDGDLADLGSHEVAVPVRRRRAPAWARVEVAAAGTAGALDSGGSVRAPGGAGAGVRAGAESAPAEAPGGTRGPDTAPPPSPPREPTARRTTLALSALLLAALLLYWLPALRLTDADLDRMGGLGLVSVLPVPTWAGAALLVVVFAALLRRHREHRALLLLTLMATVVSLHALPAVLESEPRFPTAWQHLGFIDYIDRTGSAVPDLDARWSWPGFFAVAAFVGRACGVTDFTEVIRWWPTVIQLVYLAPMFLLARAMRASWRARWTGVWLFALCGWVGQDYFSPQGFTFLLYLVFVAVLLVWFRTERLTPGRLLPGEAVPEPADRRQRAVLLLLLIGLFTASVPAHQLTPFMMLGVLAVLVLLRRCRLRGLPLLFGVLVAAWVCFMAEPYWSGHFDDLFGGIGGVGGNVSTSVSGRIQGGSPVHKLVLYSRVLLAGSVMALACWGWLRRRGAGYRERALPVLAFVPFLGFGMQSYGGEMALRVFMFAVPGAALLGALAFFPRVLTDGGGGAGGGTDARAAQRPPLLAPLAALLAGLLLMGGFLVARWGNETFERTRSGEVAAMDWVYAHDRPTLRLLWLTQDPVNDVTPALPWGARDMERVDYVPTAAPLAADRVTGLVEALKDAGPRSYLMVNASQVTYLELDAGYPADWAPRLLRSLDARPELHRVLSGDGVTVYALRAPPPGPVARPAPGPIGPRVTWTPWSVAGALAAVLLALLLGARELIRVTARPGSRQPRWLRRGFRCSLPLLGLFLVSLAERFWTMR
ncbi:polysaccharide biosynthesis C-terminal domain-containing protein [Streptomyces sp. J2-1]|uniref:exopolysaccharide Pel transporter PelG n=1 Tax=Streptomyces corallincola TaxID=2851888 RepID=UPI001C38F6DD|nr:exopolysaccharide Pel transporter PelG [Streptomyces corallincola]MBV2356211.1 polysaccharide biosynthesis C-terminal domain-containing protein [Streptomyces corallincola]